MFLDLAATAQPTAILPCMAIIGVVDVQAMDDDEVFLNIDLLHMYEYDRELYGQLIPYPGEVIPLLDNEARSIAADLIGGELPEDKLFTVSANLSARQGMLLLFRQANGAPYRHMLCMQYHMMHAKPVYTQVRPFNLMENKVIRDLNPDDLNKLISVSGMVTRTSNIIPDLRYETCMLLIQQVSALHCNCTLTYITVPDLTWVPDDGIPQPAALYLIYAVHAGLDSSGVQLVAWKCRAT